MTAQEAIRLFSDIHPINGPVLTGRRRQESQEEQAKVEAWSRCDGLDRQQLDVGQNGRPREPQMWMSSLVLTIHNFGVPNFDPYLTRWLDSCGFGDVVWYG